MKKALVVGCLSVLGWGLACGTDPLFETERDSVLTIGVSGTFSGKTTYYMPPSVVELCLQQSTEPPPREAVGGEGGGTNYDPYCYTPSTLIDPDILDAFEENMEALDYERVLTREEADLALTVGVVTLVDARWNLSVSYCYPDSYFEGCVLPQSDDGVRAGPGGYVAHLLDLEDSSDDDSSDGELVPLWTAVIHKNNERAAVRTGSVVTEAEGPVMERAIGEAFAQSPYLAEGGQ